MDFQTPDNMTPDAIALAISEAIKGGRLASWSEMPAFLVKECHLSEEDALTVSQAVGHKWQEEFFPPIHRMELFITENCNLRCDYCFVEGKNAFHAMSPETARRSIDFLFAHSRDAKQLHIFFMGGEPFLEFELMRMTAEYAEKLAKEQGKGLEFSVTTNGTLFSEESLAFCAKHQIKYLLSIDGDQETHDQHRKTASGRGSFDMLMRWLPRMKYYQPWMGARMTVHPDTAHRIVDNVRFLIDRGINQFIIGPATGQEWPEEALEAYQAQMIDVANLYKEKRAEGVPLRFELFDQLENLCDKKGIWGCQAGRHSITIAANGDIYPCSKMLGLNDLGGIYRLGDLEQGITEVDARSQLIAMWGKKETKCITCDMADSCAGGCFADNYQATGSIFQPWETECCIVRRNLAVRRYAAQLLGVTARDEKAGEECAV